MARLTPTPTPTPTRAPHNRPKLGASVRDGVLLVALMHMLTGEEQRYHQQPLTPLVRSEAGCPAPGSPARSLTAPPRPAPPRPAWPAHLQERMENLQLGLDWMKAHGVVQGSSVANVTARELEAADDDAACAVLLALAVHYDILRRGDLPLRVYEWSPSDLLLRWVRSLSPNPPLSRVRWRAGGMAGAWAGGRVVWRRPRLRGRPALVR